MAKRSKRRAVRRDKYQAGCMWGLISIFDFRHGRFTRRLLSDRIHETNRSVASPDAEYPAKPEMVASSDNITSGENEMRKSDAVRTSVKKLMEEEMLGEQVSKMAVSDCESEFCKSDCEDYVKKNQQTIEKSCDIDNSDRQIVAQKVSGCSDLEGMMEELFRIYQRNADTKHVCYHGLDAQSNDAYSSVEEKLVAAVKVFMNRNISDSQNGKIHKSKEFVDALQRVCSNKELFLKLVNDSNSLLVKSSQVSQHAQLEEDQKAKSMIRSNFSDDKPRISTPDSYVSRRHHNFFRRRSKSQESIPSLKESDKSQIPSRIVVLKPRHFDNGINDSPSLQPYAKLKNEAHNERNSSPFSFMEIKRKLKHAMGKDKILRETEKAASEGSSGWSSPNRDHFYTERFAKVSTSFNRGSRVSKLRETERKIVGGEIGGSPKQGESSIYLEAKKHLLEMFSTVDENAEIMIRKTPKTLGKILCVPGHMFSPGGSPTKEFVTTQLKSSSYDSVQMLNENQSCFRDDKTGKKLLSSRSLSELSDERYCGQPVEQIVSFPKDESASEGVLKIEENHDTEGLGDGKILDVSCEPWSSSNGEVICEDFSGGLCDDERSRCLNSDSFGEGQLPSSPTVSSSCFSHASKTEEQEISVDRTGRPSPVSVLEPIFSEDDISPARTTVSWPVEAAIQPLHIHFEETVTSANDQELGKRTCMQNDETAFEYVEAVLLASDVNWDDFRTRWLSLDQPLDPSLFDEVELFSNCSCHDQKLLFDCTNEILQEVCDFYLGKNRAVPKAMNLILEVWGRVEVHLQNTYSRSLDQLIRKDLGKAGSWMELRVDMEHIVIEIEEWILDGLIEDFFLILDNSN